MLYCLSVVVRIYLGYFSILYGMVKVLKVQFGDYLLINLLTPLGDFSSMGLLWNFMSFSPAYNVFVGLGEVIGGALLFFRKTTLLGAMILIAVFSNVVMLNFTFDVPVKLFSSLLLLLALILFSLEGKRVLYFFLNQPTIPSSPPVIFEARINRRTIDYIKVLFLIILLAETFASAYQSKVSLPPLYGIYEVESFKLNQAEVSSLGNNEHRWKRMIIDKHNLFYLQNRFGDYRLYQFEPGTTQHNIKIYRGKRGNEALYEFTYKIDETSQMILKGNYMGDTLEILLTHRDSDDFLLTSRGFHWVNEKTFNPFP
ncbi:hypothetical protein PZB74_21295 [Porifericola rhodea]|uniref:hypothetical protein n=1 Tax=Porifericola rhodea TaxID=930972 RepID=UPI00266619C6|nr:hypothetical protein [Porifericola rhodea]WKN31488.1 hypothetical protein PZB74_21295 [Porifericola rhodea]